MKKKIPNDGSIYRCLKYCGNCPFKDNGEAINLITGRVDSIKEYLLGSNDRSFNCHKTVYDLDEQMQPTEEQELKMCYGAFRFLLENNSFNQQMQIALRLGIDEELMKNYKKITVERGKEKE